MAGQPPPLKDEHLVSYGQFSNSNLPGNRVIQMPRPPARRPAFAAAITMCILCGCTSWKGDAPASAGASHDADEAEIRAYLKGGEAATPFVREAPDLDWENAFGIRYNDLAKRDAFYAAAVAPLQAGDTGGTLEVRIRFIEPSFAVADEYWREIGQRDVDTLKRGPDRWGRTTYLFEKTDGKWIELIERVADLRLAYYKHYDAMPVPEPLSNAEMTTLEGVYGFHHTLVTLARAGNRFAVTLRRRADPAKLTTLVGIPVSSTSVLLFDPGDLAEYRIFDLVDGVPTLSRCGDDPAIPAQRGSRGE